MKVVYRYLQSTVIGNEEARKLLWSLPCVIVDMGYTLVKPRQVAINLFEEDQIIPYLFKVQFTCIDNNLFAQQPCLGQPLLGVLNRLGTVREKKKKKQKKNTEREIPSTKLAGTPC